jgi:hypothetical protein
MTGITAIIPTMDITAKIPAPANYGNYPGYGYGSQPKARQTWYYSPTAIIRM